MVVDMPTPSVIQSDSFIIHCTHESTLVVAVEQVCGDKEGEARTLKIKGTTLTCRTNPSSSRSVNVAIPWAMTLTHSITH